MADRHRLDGRGQATVELAILLPLLALFLLLILQLGLVMRDQVVLHNAAREAARQAAVLGASDPAVIQTARTRTTGLRQAQLTVQSRSNSAAGTVTATLRYRSITDLPLVGALVPDMNLSASVTMLDETAL